MISMTTLKCSQCNKEFLKKTTEIKCIKRRKGQTNFFCSTKCTFSSYITRQICTCDQCGKKFTKKLSSIKPNGRNFCSSSCSCTYNNTHRKIGYRRSKLELYLEQILPKLYPELEFHFGRKDAINSELDIYIPSLKLAFELNGIFHYEPIYGDKKLQQTKNNDHRKFQACGELGIGFCVIDTSKQEKFTEKSSQVYLDIITKIINETLNQCDSI